MALRRNRTTLIGMAPFGFLLIIFIIHNCVGEDDSFWANELKANKLVAKEDIIQSIQTFGPYWRTFGDDWVVMPDGDGNTMYSVMEDKKVLETAKTLNFLNMDEKIDFYLYTRENPDGVAFRMSTIKNLTLNPTRSTKIICHGWMSDSSSTVTQSIKDAFLAREGNNVIAVNWEHFSRNLLYLVSVTAVQHVGRHVGHIIDDLVLYKDISYKGVHIVGHSLGAHVAGFAGAATKSKIGRITGLDPALPGFRSFVDKNKKLDDTDAEFVDIIHTCAGFLGVSIPIGHVDFYPNGGSTCQPGCKSDGINLAVTEACSHSRSFQFFAESINPELKYIAIKCEDWDHFINNQCENVFETMGEYVSKNLTGIFYLKTNEEAPFAMGINGTIF